jgi:hypothetical protein
VRRRDVRSSAKRPEVGRKLEDKVEIDGAEGGALPYFTFEERKGWGGGIGLEDYGQAQGC